MKLGSIVFACILTACGGEVEESVSTDAIAATAPKTRQVELCFRYGHSFTLNGGDRPLVGSHYQARGVRFLVTKSGESTGTFYNADGVTGCKTIELARFTRHSIKVLSKATFDDGNSIHVMNDEVRRTYFSWTAEDDLLPDQLYASPGTHPVLTYDWEPYPGGSYTVNISTVMSALTESFATHSMTSGARSP